MYIISLDTGDSESAFVIYNKETKQLADKHILPNVELVSRFKNFCKNNKVDLALIEMSASYGMPIGMPVLMNVFVIGFFSQFFKNLGIPVKLIFRKTVKMELCGALNKVNDSAVNLTIQDMYWGYPGCKTKKNINPFYNNEETEKNEARYEMQNDLWAALSILTAYISNPKCVENQKELSKLDQRLLKYLGNV